jgi:molybdopterin-guanine dinucleotide biosynthesis protein A
VLAFMAVQAAVILAGGQGRRLGGLDKPGLKVGDQSLLEIALAAVRGGLSSPSIVVVGPLRQLPDDVVQVREDPPGGGPAAAVAAGVAALPSPSPALLVALLAADLPGITAGVLRRLTAALTGEGGDPFGGAVLVDAGGRRQYLTGVWRHSKLSAAVRRRPDWAGMALRELLAPIQVIELVGSEDETADVDTPADWGRWQS